MANDDYMNAKVLEVLLNDEKVSNEFYTIALGKTKDALLEIYQRTQKTPVEKKPQEKKAEPKKDKLIRILSKEEISDMVNKIESGHKTEVPSIETPAKQGVYMNEEEKKLAKNAVWKYEVLKEFHKVASKDNSKYRQNFAELLIGFYNNISNSPNSAEKAAADNIEKDTISVASAGISDTYLVPELVQIIDQKVEGLKKDKELVNQNREFFNKLAWVLVRYGEALRRYSPINS